MDEFQNFEYLKFQYGKENLHDVFSTTLDTFTGIKDAHVTGHINLWQLLQKIKYNLVYDIEVSTLLTHKYLGGSKNTLYDQIKEKLPAVCYNANFDGYKDNKYLLSTTNLMFLDIDDFNTTEEAQAYKNHITLKYDWIVACNLSLSRLGLHVIILVDRIVDNDDYNRKYDFISTVYFNGRLDKNGKSLTRYAIVPFDLNVYINESPNMLNIEHIMKSIKKGISSGYKERRGISTACTFSSPSTLNSILNDAARKDALVFREYLDESLFTDPNSPIYFPEGKDVMKVNMRPFHDRKVKDGVRTYTLGGLTVRLIFINAELPKRKDKEVREAILKLIIKVNKEICDPPLPLKELLHSYNSNWKKYIDGELDFNRYFEKQRSFWSRECTLNGNEKRKVTCRIKNEPVVAESRKKIADAIEDIHLLGKKITQMKVAKVSGLGLSTVKKYWKEYKDLVRLSNNTILNKSNGFSEARIKQRDRTFKTDANSIGDNQEPIIYDDRNSACVEESVVEIEIIEDLVFKSEIPSLDSDMAFSLSEEVKLAIFDRIFHSLKSRLDGHQNELLFSRFINQFDALSPEDQRLLSIDINDIYDSSTYWKQSALESTFFRLCIEL